MVNNQQQCEKENEKLSMDTIIDFAFLGLVHGRRCLLQYGKNLTQLLETIGRQVSSQQNEGAQPS